MVYRVEAVAREAMEQNWDFEFDGQVYVLPGDMDMRAAALLSVGDLEGGLRVLLGAVQWKRLCDSPLVFGSKQLMSLLEAYAADIGVDLGESVASSPSSNATATPSRPTSNGTTAFPSLTSSLPPSA
jgi:hypothetical protein